MLDPATLPKASPTAVRDVLIRHQLIDDGQDGIAWLCGQLADTLAATVLSTDVVVDALDDLGLAVAGHPDTRAAAVDVLRTVPRQRRGES